MISQEFDPPLGSGCALEQGLITPQLPIVHVLFNTQEMWLCPDMTQTKQLSTGMLHHKTNIQTKLLCKDTVQSEKVQTLVMVFKIGTEFGMTV